MLRGKGVMLSANGRKHRRFLRLLETEALAACETQLAAKKIGRMNAPGSREGPAETVSMRRLGLTIALLNVGRIMRISKALFENREDFASGEGRCPIS
jgi:hypothetical protein